MVLLVTRNFIAGIRRHLRLSPRKTLLGFRKHIAGIMEMRWRDPLNTFRGLLETRYGERWKPPISNHNRIKEELRFTFFEPS